MNVNVHKAVPMWNSLEIRWSTSVPVWTAVIVHRSPALFLHFEWEGPTHWQVGLTQERTSLNKCTNYCSQHNRLLQHLNLLFSGIFFLVCVVGSLCLSIRINKSKYHLITGEQSCAGADRWGKIWKLRQVKVRCRPQSSQTTTKRARTEVW